ncbi:hypothetical protein GCM10025791_17190 [Halioxenophilus aromaticivorans]|uniref:Uncharacterized protein n=2 Tax=Halioxenophilus aromaticivorans TaxID=1306992 RepID=A0AAV3U185_9ALTE
MMAIGVGTVSAEDSPPSDESDADMVVDVIGTMPEDAAPYLFSCRKGTAARRVSIHYMAVGQPVPCEVNYFKDNGVIENTETLWYAQHEVGYCEQQAQGLVERLKAWGWQCQE